MQSGLRLEKRKPTGQHFLMMVDLDHFKEVNDTYGHDAGDAVLCHVVDTLTEMTRKTDAVCRIGGDEFVVILRDANLKGAKQKIIEIIDALESLPFVWEGKDIQIGASVDMLKSCQFQKRCSAPDRFRYVYGEKPARAQRARTSELHSR